MTTEIVDLGGMDAGDVDTEAILAKMGGQAGSYTETLPDGTTVTYEVDMEEFEVRILRLYWFILLRNYGLNFWGKYERKMTGRERETVREFLGIFLLIEVQQFF